MKNIVFLLMFFTGLLQAGSIRSEEHDSFTRGFRVLVNARITDSTGIYEARVYFKRHRIKDYQVYALMECTENRCHAELPISDVSLKRLDYIIVYQNSAGVSFKSKTYTMEKRDMLELPAWQTLNTQKMTVYSEYAKAPRWVNGFSDKMDIQKSSEEEAMGAAVGIYSLKLIRPEIEIPCPKCKECKE